jgi:hypothetical protein
MHIRRKLTYANVMSSIAVFLVVGGASAFAASQFGKNSVGTRQLKRNAVTTVKLKRNAVTGTKIRAGSITTSKIKNHSVTAAKLKAGVIAAPQLGANSVGNSQTQLVKVFKAGAQPAAASEAAAPKVELGTVGPFHFYGKCFQTEKAVVESTYVEITSGSATLGSGNGKKETNVYLTPGMAEEQRALATSSAEANAIGQASGVSFEAAATDGTIVTGIASGGAAKKGTPTAGNGPFLAGDSCIVGTTVVFGGK